MYNLICVSNRTLCFDGFEQRVREIADLGIDVILREKALTDEQYYSLLCRIDRKSITAHTYADAAHRFGIKKIHMPLALLTNTDLRGFDAVGVSVHSVSDAVFAEQHGASYVTLGHIFATDCKPGVPPRGIELIGEVKRAVSIPVYAIGGISPDNAEMAVRAGADGVCAMSGFMQCENVTEYIQSYKRRL